MDFKRNQLPAKFHKAARMDLDMKGEVPREVMSGESIS